MFKVVYNSRTGAHTVRDVKKARVYLHSDGAVFDTPEYWPTQELAQAVLDKYQPKHVWEHGDVFIAASKCNMFHPMMFVNWGGHAAGVIHLDKSGTHVHNRVDSYLSDATFLFNIREKL